jgi:glycosyltransferase involved in cell wall biosynthesis
LLCHKVVVISSDNYARARRCFLCRNKFTLIRNGLPKLSFEVRERARISLALKAGLTDHDDGNTFWIGAIAELTKNKGLTYLIEAAAILKIRRQADALPHFFIVGGGEDEQALKKLTKEKGLESRVHFVGFVSDAYRFDLAFDLFALTSVKEGLPTVLLEAGQAHVAVVATNIPGTRDIIENEKTGLLVEPKNPKDLAEKISRLMQDAPLRTRLVEKLNQKVLKEFSIERMVEETKKLY